MTRKHRRIPARPNLDPLFAQATTHHQAGRLAEAEALYREILARVPDHPDGLHLLGVLAHQTGHGEAALSLIRRAVALKPDEPAFHSNLGIVLRALGRPDEAEAHWRRTLALSPGHLEAHLNLGSLCQQRNRPAEAEAHYRRALALRPDHPEALLNLGVVLKTEGRPAEAEACYRRALALRPDTPELLMNLGNALHDLGRLGEALAVYRRAVALKPGLAEAHLNLGNALKSQGAGPEAMAAYDRALALRPELAEAHNNRGHLLQEQGRLAEAMAEYDRALAIRPDHAETLYNRADLKRFRAGDPDLAALETLAAGADRLPAGQAMFLHFALGKALEDAGDTPRAFEQFLKGNALKRRRLAYDEAAGKALFERIAERFDRALFRDRPETGDPSPLPIFIVGMPRSGSTLVEQILASHPLVFGGGELGALAEVTAEVTAEAAGRPTPYPDFVPGLEPEALARFGRAYLARLPEIPAGRSRITDKMPGNFFHLGLIRLILPRAKIIHTVRDPVDTCLSCFSKLFVDRQEFSFELGELGRYYRRYRTLMEHWRAVLPPDSLLDVRYEAVVADLETEARRLIAWCDLPWDGRCLDFHQTPRTVRTASSAQVRQPLYRTALDRGHRYRAWLEPLLRELEGDGPAESGLRPTAP